MVIKINLRSVFLTLAMALILISTNAVAIAQEGTDDRPPVDDTSGRSSTGIITQERGVVIPGGPGFISIHPSQFLPRSSDINYAFYGNKELYNDNSESIDAEFFAPLSIPDQATINQLVVYYFDENNDTEDISVTLLRCDFGSAVSCENMGSVVSSWVSGKYGYVMTSIFANAQVNNQSYSYVLKLTIPNGFGVNLTLVNLRVDFDYPTYLPTVLN